MAKNAVDIPYLPDGSIPSYVEYGGTVWVAGVRTPVTWLPAEDFHAVLTLKEMVSGRSRHNMVWRNGLTGATYSMSQARFNGMVKHAEWVAPLTVDGRWRPVKRGANYLIEPVYAEDL